MAVDKAGNVYVNVTEADGRVKIWKFSPAGEGPFLIADIGIGTAHGLAADAEGDVNSGDRLRKPRIAAGFERLLL